jgi:DNA-binding LacI/PurR family transcriptional regulator
LAAALGLSTVREPLTEMGATAAAMLLDSMSPPHTAETTTVPTTFVIRETA